MDIYEILITHNRAWSKMECLLFFVLAVLIFLFLRMLVQGDILNKMQAIAAFGLFVYLWVVLESTVFTRDVSVINYKLLPFWSWIRIITKGDLRLLQEDILNCILLLPMGCLLPLVMGQKVPVKKAAIGGLLFSMVIEFSQLLFRRGLFEWDDMMHNALGCAVGCYLVNRLMEKYKRK